MKKTKKIAAAVLAMTMAAGLAVTGCSGKGGSTDTDPAAAEQSKETAGSAGESKDDAAKADDGALHLTFYYPVNVGGSAAQLIEKICADFNAGRNASGCVCKSCNPAFHHGIHRHGHAS